ncbi:MAG: hypothetical protein NC900_03695 [Candidatus Omnitrophica bacterium]|nr:hypothetical protein [Candidatus Omnitrophota bacterium]
MAGLIFPFIYIISNSKELTLRCSLYVLIFFLIIEFLRFINSNFNSWLFKRFKLILKEEERNHPLNTSFFLIFLNLAIWFFRKEIVIYAVFFVIIGDIVAGLVGKNFGHIRIGNKTLEGAISFFFSCLILGWLLNLTSFKIPLLVIIPASFICSLVELFSKLDDNFTVGLSCCITMELILRLIS